jgi:hypothetical protein
MKLALIILLVLAWLGTIGYVWFKKTNRYQLQILAHTFLFLVIYLLISPFNYVEKSKNSKICVFDKKTTEMAILPLKDSLKILEFLHAAQFKNRILNGDFKEKEIILAGTDFTPDFLALLANYKVKHWVNIPKNEIQSLSYQAIVAQNQTQIVRFLIDVDKKQFAKLKLGTTTLDSVLLDAGQNSAELSFPVFGIGRNEVVLETENSNIPLHFFGLKASPKNIQIRTSSPDFEFKTLADWLTKKGHNVQLITDVSANINSEITYLKNSKAKELDLYICSPDKIREEKNLKTKAVFVMGLNNAEKDIAKINSSLGTSFSFQKNGILPLRKLENGAEVLPYLFKPKASQFYAQEYEIISESARVGTTMLQSTYSLILAGDSIAYAKIWNNLFQLFNNTNQKPWLLESPIIQHLTSNITVPFPKDSLTFEKTKVGIINNKAFIFSRNTGWISLNDSLEVFVDSTNYFYSQFSNIKKSLPKRKNLATNGLTMSPSPLIPNEVLYLLLIVIYGSIWVINRR